MDKPRLEYQEALKTYRELAQKNPDAYLPHVADTLNNLGILDHDQNRMDQARLDYQEALRTYHGLAQKNPDTYLNDVASIKTNIANLYHDKYFIAQRHQDS